MRLFDRHSKLRTRFRSGRLLDEPKQMLPLLKGTLSKEDLPALIVEPSDVDELRATLDYAAEKHMKVAVGAGLTPTSVRDLAEHALILTTRLSASPIFSRVRGTARVTGGFPAESLAIDLSHENLDWWPLFPAPPGKSVGALIAEGWEGLRNFRRGGMLAHIQLIEWVGYDGKIYGAGWNEPEAAGLLFGSRGKLGIVISALLTLHPAMKSRSAVLLEFASADDAALCIGELAAFDPQPESVVVWGKTATEIIRQGNDGTITDQARCVVLAEWDEERIQLPPPWDGFGVHVNTDSQVKVLWQDVLRLPRTAARLYPGRLEARVRLPLEALPALEEAATDLGRDANLSIAVWGTVQLGYMYLWVMLPDEELKTRTRGTETLNKLTEIAVSLGATRAAGDVGVPRLYSSTPEGRYGDQLRALVRERCDPKSMHTALNAE